MLAPEVVKTIPSPSPTPRMLVDSVPTLVFHLMAPVRPSTAKTFCWLVCTYSTPSWATTVLCWVPLVLPPSRLRCQAPPRRRTLLLVISRSELWLWFPRFPPTLGKSRPGARSPLDCEGTGKARPEPASARAGSRSGVKATVPPTTAAPVRKCRRFMPLSDLGWPGLAEGNEPLDGPLDGPIIPLNGGHRKPPPLA